MWGCSNLASLTADPPDLTLNNCAGDNIGSDQKGLFSGNFPWDNVG